MNKKTVLTFMLCIFSLFAYAQQSITVKGTVTDTDNNPLIGAAVAVVGTSSGVITDLDGNYTITVSPTQSLQFSYVGYEGQTIKVNGRTTINVQLVEGQQLEEVVVIGYGTIKKKDLTGAVASVTGKQLQANIARNATSALQGRIAGVTVTGATGQPGEGMNINIRGINSLNSTTPLYVIDGVYGDINMVDPADIQSIDVLKDASAAAIYGSRAANGVVIVTTKGGKRETPTRVEINAYTGVQTIAKYVDMMDGNELRDFARQTGYSNSAELLDWDGGAGTDWQKALYRTAMVSKVGLNVSGGNKTATFNVSGSYLNQEGIVKTTGYEAWNIRAKNDFSLFNNHVRVGSTILMKIWKKKYDSVSQTSTLIAVPQWNVYDAEGNWAPGPSWARGDNPVGIAEAYDDQKQGIDLLVNAYAEVDLGLKGLKYKFNVGVDKYTNRTYNYAKPYVFSSTSQNPSYNLSEGTNWEDQWMIENTLHYDNIFGKNTVSALAGYSAQRNSARGFGAGRTHLPPLLNVIDAGTQNTKNNGSAWANSLISMFGRVMYSYDDRYMFSASIRRDGSSKFSKGHRWGTFPSASVGWNIANEKFFENAQKSVNELKIRASYGVLGNLNGIGNYATQPTATPGLNSMQGEDWWIGQSTGSVWLSPYDVTWEKTKTLNFGIDAGILNNKLTLSVDYFIQKTEDMLLSVPQPASFGLRSDPTMNAGTVENKGVEIALNHRNVVGEVSYHIGANATFIKNELTKVNSSRQEWAGFNPHGKGTITYAKVGYPIGYFNLIKSDGIFQSQAEIDAYVDDKGNKIQPKAVPGDLKYVDYNHDGVINNNDRQDCGSAFPKVTMGLTMGLEWKGIDLNMFFDGNFGNKIYNAVYYSTVYNEGTGNQFRDRLKSWSETNKNTSVPRYVSGNDDNGTNWAYTDRWLENGSFFRLKTLELGYTLPKTWTAKASMQSVRIYTAMDNLFTITKYKGYTPDLGTITDSNAGVDFAGSISGVMTRGCDAGRYPTARSFTFGLQVNF